MGFFDFLKPRSKENIESCWPGGKMLQVHIEYDTANAVFTYFGLDGNLQMWVDAEDSLEL